MDTSAGFYRIYAQTEKERERAQEHTHMVVKNVSPLFGVVGIVCEQIRKRKRKCIVVVLWTVIMWPLLKVSGSVVHHKSAHGEKKHTSKCYHDGA